MNFLVILGLLIFYALYKGRVVFPDNTLMSSSVIAIFMAIAIAGVFLYRKAPEAYHSTWFIIFSWVGAYLMGLFGTFLLLSLPSELISIFWRGHARDITLWVFGISVVISLIGLGKVFYGPIIEAVDIPIQNLPQNLRDLKIVQVSDLHVGPTIRRGYVESVVKKINALNPDAVVFTGDIVDALASSIKDEVIPLKDLKSPHGAFYVTGNHEYYWGAEEIISLLKSVGLKPLLNEHATFKIKDETVLIAGITDPVGGYLHKTHRPDIHKASQTSADPVLKILLTHRPEPFDDAEKLDYHLMVAGHTHGGQFFPFNLFMPIAHKYYRGLNRHQKLWVYVNSGTGYWGPVNRFAVMPEITLFRFRSEN